MGRMSELAYTENEALHDAYLDRIDWTMGVLIERYNFDREIAFDCALYAVERNIDVEDENAVREAFA